MRSSENKAFSIVLIAGLAIGFASGWSTALATDRWVFSGGGGRLEAGIVQLESVIGQPVVGRLEQGSTSLSAGFLFGQSASGPGSFGVTLDLPAMAHPGEPFWVTGNCTNSGDPRTVNVFFLLDVYGVYWFWPSWVYFNPPESTGIDFRTQNIPSGDSEIEVLPEFIWPDTGDDTVTGLYFYGAFLNEMMNEVIGDWDAQSFGYGP
jgi:hypothetical protein